MVPDDIFHNKQLTRNSKGNVSVLFKQNGNLEKTGVLSIVIYKIDIRPGIIDHYNLILEHRQFL